MFFTSPVSGRPRRATMDPNDSQYTNLPTRRRDSIAGAHPYKTSSSIPRPSASPTPLFQNTREKPSSPSQTTGVRVPEFGRKSETNASPVRFVEPSPKVRDASSLVFHPPLKDIPDKPHTSTPKKRLASRMSKPDPWLLLDELKTLLNGYHEVLWVSYLHGKGGSCGSGERRYNGSRPECCICGLLDIDNILALHERDVMEWGQRRRSFARTDDDTLRVFGVSLREVSIYASSTRIFGGYQHDLPIVVFSCVEELFKTGIYQKGLFRDLPNRERLIELIHIFDSGPSTMDGKDLSAKGRRVSFGEDFSLRAESMPDVCALFSTYLSSLPEPILCPTLFEAFWALCVKPSLVRDDGEGGEDYVGATLGDENAGRRDSGVYVCASIARQTNYESVVTPSSDESKQIRIAQILLGLLPTANFSLLVYLFSFFTQIPLSSENGIGFEDIARIFAAKVLGRPEPEGRGRSCIRNTNRSGDHDTGRVARRMMIWLLKRWGRISNGLIHGVREDGGLFPLCSAKPEPLVLSAEPSPTSSLLHNTNVPSLAREGKPFSDDFRIVSPANHADVPEDQSFELLPSDRLFQMDANDNASVYSSTALDERLLDVALPKLWVEPSLSPTSPSPSSASASTGVNDRRIVELQHELERSELAVADAVRETLVARAEAQALAKEVAVLKEQREEERSGVEALRKKLEIAERKWDEAWGLVKDAKELVGGV